jgi:hypothetical protein
MVGSGDRGQVIVARTRQVDYDFRAGIRPAVVGIERFPFDENDDLRFIEMIPDVQYSLPIDAAGLRLTASGRACPL